MSDANHPERFGRYELISVLGRGAMGVVYKAHDSFLGRTVAVKTYRQDIAANENVRRRFEREVRTASRLQHPNIVTVYDGGLENGVPYLAMELVEGTNLESELERRGRLSITEALSVIDQIVAGLGCAHEQGVIHRDLKPANILLSSSGQAKIADFGVAKLATADTGATVNPVGTPSYMSPEQVSGKPVDVRADVFAVGILSYELLTGEKPFSGDTWTAVLFQILNAEPRPPSEVRPELPRGVDAVLARAMHKEIADRTPDVETFRRELRAAFEQEREQAHATFVGDEESAPPPPPRSPVKPPPRPREPTFDRPGPDEDLASAEGDDGLSFDLGDVGPIPRMSPVRKRKPEKRAGEPSNVLVTILLVLMILGIGVLLWQQGVFRGLPGLGPAATPTPEPTATAVPTPSPEPTPTPEPESTPTPKPRATPTPRPRPTPTPEPEPTRPPPTVPAVVPTRPPIPSPTPAKPAGATMDVISTPTRAEVWVNGEMKGNTPVRIADLAPGKYVFEVRLEGYVPYKRVAELEPKARYEMKVTLVPVVNSLRITSEPPGAHVVVNGLARGRTPVTLSGLESGTYEVEVSLEGTPPHTRTVELKDGRLTELKFELETTKTPGGGGS